MEHDGIGYSCFVSRASEPGMWGTEVTQWGPAAGWRSGVRGEISIKVSRFNVEIGDVRFNE